MEIPLSNLVLGSCITQVSVAMSDVEMDIVKVVVAVGCSCNGGHNHKGLEYKWLW